MSTDAEPTQITFKLNFPSHSGLESFVVGDSNRHAWTMIRRWPLWPHPRLIVHGQEGVGKSHLLRAWSERSDAVICDARDRDAMEMLLTTAPRVFAVENVDMANDEKILFHVMNSGMNVDTCAVLTSRKPPNSIQPTLPDLASRLRAWLSVAIEPPGDDVLVGIMRKIMVDRGIETSPANLHYALRRMERTAKAAIHIVEHVDDLALTEQRPVTRAMFDHALHSLSVVSAEAHE